MLKQYLKVFRCDYDPSMLESQFNTWLETDPVIKKVLSTQLTAVGNKLIMAVMYLKHDSPVAAKKGTQ